MATIKKGEVYINNLDYFKIADANVESTPYKKKIRYSDENKSLIKKTLKKNHIAHVFKTKNGVFWESKDGFKEKLF